jgi:hypothetical protein
MRRKRARSLVILLQTVMGFVGFVEGNRSRPKLKYSWSIFNNVELVHTFRSVASLNCRRFK